MNNSIKKILLINWMYFQKSLLEFDGNMALVGVNGTGKSTIIDAIQMLLLGQRAAKFNSGADALKRTLESYVRGHVNLENKEFLRDGDVITYLAFEVSVNNKTYIFAQNIEYKVKQARLSDVKYFTLEDISLTEDLFVDDNYPKSFEVLNKELKKNNKYEVYNTLSSYQNKIRDVFGLKDSKGYFKILSRAIGLKNITECNKFINDFVLDENNIDVNNLKNSVLEMNKITNMISLEEEKLNDLSEITTLGEEINDKLIYANNLDLKINLSNYLYLNEQIENAENDNRISLSELNNITNQINDNKLLQEYKIENQNELKNKLKNISPDLYNLELNLKNKKNELKEESSYNDILYKRLIELKTTFKIIKSYDNSYSQYYKYLDSKSFESSDLYIKLKDASDNTNSKKDYLNIELHNKKIEVKEVNNNLQRLDLEIKLLRNNKFSYKEEYLKFKEYLASNLKDKYKRDIEIKFLAEYLEITDETYRDAIEGYLANQRFYLIIDSQYYNDALRLYEENKEFSSIRIINSRRVPNMTPKEGTLGALIESSNSIAKNYALYILNRVKIVDNIYDLENYDIAITKDCLCYQNYTVFRLNKKNYEYYYIGELGLKKQLEIKELEHLNLEVKANILIKEYKSMNNELENYNNLDRQIKFLLENNKYINSIDNIIKLEKIINELDNQVKLITEDKTYIDIQIKINNIEEEINKIVLENHKFEDQVIEIKSHMKNNDNLISENKDKLELCKESLTEFNDIDIENCRYEISDQKLSIFFINKLRNELAELNRTNDKQIFKIENMMKSVRNKYNLNIETEFKNIKEFVNERNKISSDIFKYKSKLIEMKERHYDLFFNEFLNKLYKSVNDAKQNIKALNDSLVTFKFGSDYYTIKLDITDNYDLKEIYEFSKEYNSDSYNRSLLIDNQLLESKKNKIFELISKYIFSDNIDSQNYIVDYRNYLNFDVIVHTKEGVKSLNKVLQSQSGGEVQVPFYILSGVAFKQTLDYKRNNNAMAVVLYDEAFDKMDSQRITSMIDFYKNVLGLQIVLAAPGKLESLANTIDNIFVVIKDGYKAIVKDFSHEGRK